MNSTVASVQLPECAAFVALDWADQVHAWALQVDTHATVELGSLQNTPEAVEVWAQQLDQRFQGRMVAVAIEQRRGAVIAMLTKYAHLLIYSIHPSTLASYRKGFYPSGAKSDPGDAQLLLELLIRHRDRLQLLRPDTVETRKLQLLVEHRRKLVQDRAAYSNQLTSWLKQIFPQVLRWFADPATAILGDFLKRWPTLEHARRARAETLRKFFHQHHSHNLDRIEERIAELQSAVPATHDKALLEAGVLAVQDVVALIATLRQAIAKCEAEIEVTERAHPDFAIIDSFPAAGPALRPRLLAVLGTQRDRFGSASGLQCFCGIAPVVARSGQQLWVHWRWSCPKFIRQTIHEWALHSIRQCEWAREFYDEQRAKEKSHHTSVRALAFKWLRILWRCWKDRTPYDESRYLRARGGKTKGAVQTQWKSEAGFWKAGQQPA
jgi:transposase